LPGTTWVPSPPGLEGVGVGGRGASRSRLEMRLQTPPHLLGRGVAPLLVLPLGFLGCHSSLTMFGARTRTPTSSCLHTQYLCTNQGWGRVSGFIFLLCRILFDIFYTQFR
jgi:hypothetical protein